MGVLIKKILVVLPVLVLTIFFLHDRYEGLFGHSTLKRIGLFLLTIALLYGWILAETARREQRSLAAIGVQSSFFVYVFMVLTLTGYFILFKEVSTHHWWSNMWQRVERKQRVNLELFKAFSTYKLTNKQILGNLVMLLPLGIYLPLLYKSMSNFFVVALTALLVSVSIELLQLITSYRITDVDDVLLNSLGACVGYLLYRLFKPLLAPPKEVLSRPKLSSIKT